MSNEERIDKILLNNSYWASPPTDVGKMFEIGLNEKGIKQAKAELTKLILEERLDELNSLANELSLNTEIDLTPIKDRMTKLQRNLNG